MSFFYVAYFFAELLLKMFLLFKVEGFYIFEEHSMHNGRKGGRKHKISFVNNLIGKKNFMR